jgi:UDP-N-acetylmuramate--alanine ligase
MRFLRDELIATIATTLRPQDHFIFLPIFYAGGTAQQDISSELLTQQLQQQGAAASHSADRQHCQHYLLEQAQPGDVILLMGARDPSLPHFVHQLVAAVQSGE